MAEDTPMSGGFGATSGSDIGRSGMAGNSGADLETCPTCGAKKGGVNASLDQFLGRIGISDDMIDSLKSSMQNVDIEQYLDTARDFLKGGGNKATSYAKEHPGQVAAGVAVLAVGA